MDAVELARRIRVEAKLAFEIVENLTGAALMLEMNKLVTGVSLLKNAVSLLDSQMFREQQHRLRTLLNNTDL